MGNFFDMDILTIFFLSDEYLVELAISPKSASAVYLAPILCRYMGNVERAQR